MNYTFENFVEGKSNQLAVRPPVRWPTIGWCLNPLFLYGGTGLARPTCCTPLAMPSGSQKDAKVIYMHPNGFVQDMVKALQNNAIEEFKRYYRSVDAPLIDDIQFFANKGALPGSSSTPSMPRLKATSRSF